MKFNKSDYSSVIDNYDYDGDFLVRIYQSFDQDMKYFTAFRRLLRYHQRALDLAEKIINKHERQTAMDSSERPTTYENQMTFCDWHFFFISIYSIQMMVEYLDDEVVWDAFVDFKCHFGNKLFESARHFFEHYDDRLEGKLKDEIKLQGTMELGSIKDLEFHFEDGKNIDIEDGVEEINRAISVLLDELDKEMNELDEMDG